MESHKFPEELLVYSYSRTYYHRVTSTTLKRVFKLNVVDITAPTVTLIDTDSDNLVSASDTVTITASFNEAMTATPTISISGVVTNVVMSPVSGTNSYTYAWDTSSGTLTNGASHRYCSGSDTSGNYFSGAESITFTLDSYDFNVTENDADDIFTSGEQVTFTLTATETLSSTVTASADYPEPVLEVVTTLQIPTHLTQQIAGQGLLHPWFNRWC